MNEDTDFIYDSEAEPNMRTALPSSPVGELVDVTQPIDDIYVRDGFCDWADVANARDEVRNLHAASLTSLSAEVARMDAEIERMRGRLRMAELMMTKDSLCEAERLEEGLHCVRAALSAPKGGEHV